MNKNMFKFGVWMYLLGAFSGMVGMWGFIYGVLR